jgi:hypothetical protein
VISEGRFLTVLFGACALGLMGVLLGAWWAPFLAGVAAGVFIVRAWRAVLAGAIAGLVAWGGPLEYAQIEFGLGRTATSLAAIMGFTGAATIPVALTLLVGVLLGFSGAWLGAAARSFYPSRRPTVRRQNPPGSAGSSASARPRTAATQPRPR